MKIIILAKNPYFYPQKKIMPYIAGHSVGFVAPFIEYLLKKNHKVVLISPVEYKNYEEIEKKFFYNRPQNSKFKHILLKSIDLPKVPFNFGDLIVQSAILNAHEMMRGVDAILVVYTFPWIVAVNYLKQDLKFKTLSFLRGSDVFSGCNTNSDYKHRVEKGMWECVNRLMIKSLNKSDKIFGVSNMLNRFANSLGIRTDGIYPTPPYPGSDILRKTKKTKQQLRIMLLRNKYMKKTFGKVNLNTKWIVYLGRFHSEKQTALIIKAFNHCKNKKSYSVLLGGSGIEKKNLSKMKHILKLKNVHIGFVPPQIIPLFLKCADVFVHPTTPQSFLDARPSTCTNASYMGVPIIFPDKRNNQGTGLHESVSRLNNQLLKIDAGLRESGIIRQMAKKIDWILSNDKLREDIGKANANFTGEFNSQLIFSRLEKQITNV